MSPPQKESQNVTDSDYQAHSPERRGSFSSIDSDVEIHTVTPVVSKARVVNMPKRIPPALPPRNPGRSTLSSPLADAEPPSEGFEQITLNGTAEEKEKAVELPSEQSPIERKKSWESDADGRRLSRATSDGAEDKFQSIPGSPVKEKDEDEANKMRYEDGGNQAR